MASKWDTTQNLVFRQKINSEWNLKTAFTAKVSKLNENQSLRVGVLEIQDFAQCNNFDNS